MRQVLIYVITVLGKSQAGSQLSSLALEREGQGGG